MKIVSKSAADRCPHCERVMRPNEGSSEHDGVMVTIQCAHCDGEYAYYDDGVARIFDAERDLYLVNEEGEVYFLEIQTEDEDGCGYVIPSGARIVSTL